MSQRAMYTAISGIRNQQTSLDVIANNISNSSTIGFKKSRTTFEESFSLLLQGASEPPGEEGGVNPLQVGSGSSIGSIDNVMSQGNIQATDNDTDLAISGDGFFVVSNVQRDYYSRAGSFQWDSGGALIIPTNGMNVQGRLADANGAIDEGSEIGDIVVQYGIVDEANATTNVSWTGNLDASADPVGNILESDGVYAREIAGETADMNGLYANGQADTQITGLSSNSTTVTVAASTSTNGDAISKTYTYVKSDTGAGSKDFHTLDDLIAEINNDFGADTDDPSISVVLDDNGALEFTDLSGQVNNTLTLSSVNSVLNTALAVANGVVGEKTTDEFSHVATASDKIIDLRTDTGVSIGLDLTDTIYVNAMIGDDEIGADGEYSLAVDDGAGESITYSDLVQMLKDSLGITNTKGVEIDSNDGSLIVNADGGTANTISGMSISSDNEAVFDTIFDSTVGNWTETRAAEDVTHSASIRVYDSLGNSHTLTLTFTKDDTQENTWTWEVAVPEPAEVSGGYTGKVSFDAEGALEAFSYSQGASSFTFDPKNGAHVPMDIVLDFGTLGQTDGISHFATTSTVIASEQDGYSAGTLESVKIDNSGVITGSFSNGNSRVMAQLVLATFNNPSGLLKVGDNIYDVSSNSGQPVYGLAGTTVNATILPGAIETSNVDIAEEFTNMIVTQRAFQANARTITTSDEILEETVNLKR